MCNLHPGQRIDILDQSHSSYCDRPFRDTANFDSIMTVCIASHTYFISHFNKLFRSQMDMVELLLYLFLVTYLARIKTFSHLPINVTNMGGAEKEPNFLHASDIRTKDNIENSNHKTRKKR